MSFFFFSTNDFLFWKFIIFSTWLKQPSWWHFMGCSWKIMRKLYWNLLLFALVSWPDYHGRLSPANSRTVACELPFRHSPDIPSWIPVLWKFCWGKWVIQHLLAERCSHPDSRWAALFCSWWANPLQTEAMIKSNILVMLYSCRHILWLWDPQTWDKSHQLGSKWTAPVWVLSDCLLWKIHTTCSHKFCYSLPKPQSPQGLFSVLFPRLYILKTDYNKWLGCN